MDATNAKKSEPIASIIATLRILELTKISLLLDSDGIVMSGYISFMIDIDFKDHFEDQFSI